MCPAILYCSRLVIWQDDWAEINPKWAWAFGSRGEKRQSSSPASEVDGQLELPLQLQTAWKRLSSHGHGCTHTCPPGAGLGTCPQQICSSGNWVFVHPMRVCVAHEDPGREPETPLEKPEASSARWSPLTSPAVSAYGSRVEKANRTCVLGGVFLRCQWGKALHLSFTWGYDEPSRVQLNHKSHPHW